GGGELDRGGALDAIEGGGDLGQRCVGGLRGQDPEHAGQRGTRGAHHASRGFRNMATARAPIPRGTERSAAVVRLFMAPFTSTGPRPTARTAWSATCSADIHAKPGTPLTSTAAFSWNSVRVKPGQTQSTRTPVPPSSAAMPSEKLSTNALVAA